MRRPFPIPVRALLVVLLALAVTSVGRAEPVRSEVPWRLSAVQPNGTGEAATLLESARDALDEERWEEAARILVDLRGRHADALVEVPRAWAGEVPLHWPAKHVVELLLPRLPEAARQRVTTVWRGEVGALVERAGRGDAAALRTLADDWAATSEGRRALVQATALDLEAGRAGDAVRRLEHLLRLPGLEDEVRARAVMQLTDALAALGDEAALADLEARFPEAMRQPVATARGRRLPAMRLRAQRADLRMRRRAEVRRAPKEADPPRDLTVLWVREHDRAGALTRTPTLRIPVRTLGGAAADGDALIVHEGAVVRRLEAHTGRELWRFPPPVDGSWNYDPRHRYAVEDLPLRTVDVVGNLVLVVLGDPVAQGSFEFLGSQVQVEDQPRASRTRLVALDRRTGRLVWATGGPGDVHPVLGDPRTGCQSPPLVVGDAVFALFARRRGASEIHLARLELATGAPRWVVYLGAGESGRSVDIDEGDDRFDSKRAIAAPWGARPTLAGGEVCVLPHAGFAAGVGAAEGAVRWLRALPRYEGVLPPDPGTGFSGRNAPLAAGAAWVLAPIDCPCLVALERGTGRWLYALATESEDGTDPWHHAVSVGHGETGGPWLNLMGTEAGRLRLSSPDEGARVGPYLEAYMPPGRPLDLGRHYVVAGAREVGAVGPHAVAEHTVPVLLDVPWDPEAQRRPDAIRRWVLADPAFPRMGDVVAAGDLRVVVGRDRTGVVAPPSAARAWARDRLAADDVDAGGRAAAAALLARLDRDPAAAADALRLAAASGDAAALDVALDAIRRVVAEHEDGLDPLGEVVLAHAPRRGADVLADLATRGAFRRRPAALIDLLDRWIRIGDDTLVNSMPGVAVRADLFAGLLLRILRQDVAMRPALGARERQHAAAVEQALAQDEAALREAIRCAVATRAAVRGREALAARLEEAGRPAAAAAVRADLRLDAGDLEAGRRGLADVAAEQRREASLLARGGHTVRARRLLHDLARWAPTARKADARREQEALEVLLAMEAGWQPTNAPPSRFDAWRGIETSGEAGEVRSVVFPTLTGPGAATRRERFLLFRGLDAEVWSRDEARRLAVFPDAGAGWFGGALQEVPTWLAGGGVIVTSVVAGEPADRAGLRAGDWVLSWDGQPLAGAASFMQRVATAEAGRPVTLDVRRRGLKVLDRIVPGSRPRKDGVVVERQRLWVDPQGRVLVPGRIDLAWVDLEDPGREAFWRWTGTGVVRRVDVIDELALVTIRRLLQHDTVVAVELTSGAERWRRDLDGTVTVLEGSGSAVVARAADPARAILLDPWAGTVRARVALQERTRDPYPLTLFPAPSAVSVLGRLWCVTGSGAYGRMLRIVNTSTGETVSEALDEHDFEPLIAGDGVVALALGGSALRVYGPDPLTGRPAWRVETPTASGTRNFPFDRPDTNTRLLLARDRLYVLRVRYGNPVSVEPLALDLEALGPAAPRGRAAPSRVLRGLAKRTVQPARHQGVYLLDARATPEGLLLSAASTGDRQQRVAHWVGADGRWRAWLDPRGAHGGVVQVRRHPPARIADVLVVPTDAGALLVPLRPGSR